MPATLEISRLTAFYGKTQALHGIDISVRRGEVTAILGANGAGKTTTLRAICQMVRSAGSIQLNDVELIGTPTESIARLGIAHVPDGRGTFTALTVMENLQLGAYVRRNKREVASDIERAFERFPILKQRRNQQAGTLSGGEQQMLAISRALMSKPELLLLDEPSFGLAPKIVAEIYEIMRKVVQEDKVSMLLVEQNARLALDIADTAYLLESGRVMLAGDAASIADDPSIKKAYLGH